MHRHIHLLYPKSLPHVHRALRLNHHATSNSLSSHLKSRSVIRFSGPDTVKFLQGLLTNDVRKFGGEPDGERTSYVPTPNVAQISVPPMYAAMLNPQGRFLYDLFLYRKPRSDEMLDRTGSGPGSDPDEELELFADVDTEVLDEAVMMFKRYRLRAKVEIENVAKEFSCWQRFGECFSETSPQSEGKEPEAASMGWGSSKDQSAMSSARGDSSGWQWFSDPRLDCLGFRGIFPSDTIPPLVEADKETDERNYILWRLEKGVAEGSTEIPKGEAMPLEYNLAGLNAISFDKGCYVGQELVARTHHRGVIRKRVLPLKFLDDDGKEVKNRVTPGSEVVKAGSGKKIGTVRTVLGCRGLGLIRLEEAFKGSGSITIQGQEDVNVDARRPDWWPNEWFQENERHSVAS